MNNKGLEIIKEDKEYILNTYNRFNLALKKGNKAKFYDYDLKEYIDFTSGIGTNSFGSCDTLFIEAITKQINELGHTSNLYYNEPQVKLAKLLCQKTNMKKVFFANSGAEANEGAIKAARKYSFDK